MSTQLACGFAAAIDGRVDKIVDNLGVVKPTFMGAAPRIFEKAHARIVTMQAAEGGAQGEDLQAGVQGRPRGRPRKREGRTAGAPRSRPSTALFDKLVFAKIRERFGGRVRFFISGAAALNQEIAEWFHAAGILILEGYGLTESSAGSFVNHPDDYKIGTVGPVFPGSRGEARRRRRGPDQGPGRDGRLPQPARGDREDADRRRLAAHRRQGRARRRRLPADHRPDQGAVQDLGRQVHRPAGDRVEVQGASAPTPASSWSSATSGTSSSPWSPSTRTPSPTGPRRTASRGDYAAIVGVRRLPEDGAGATSRS